MSSGVLTAVAASAAVASCVLLVASGLLLLAARRGRRRAEQEAAAARAEVADLTRRLDALARRLEPEANPVERARTERPPRGDGREYVITTAGSPVPGEPSAARSDGVALVGGREFASVALGESLVRLLSLGYGVRRALSAENRNRIAFEMRREVRRSRRQRRRDLKDARRRLRDPALGQDAA